MMVMSTIWNYYIHFCKNRLWPIYNPRNNDDHNSDEDVYEYYTNDALVGTILSAQSKKFRNCWWLWVVLLVVFEHFSPSSLHQSVVNSFGMFGVEE